MEGLRVQGGGVRVEGLEFGFRAFSCLLCHSWVTFHIFQGT